MLGLRQKQLILALLLALPLCQSVLARDPSGFEWRTVESDSEDRVETRPRPSANRQPAAVRRKPVVRRETDDIHEKPDQREESQSRPTGRVPLRDKNRVVRVSNEEPDEFEHEPQPEQEPQPVRETPVANSTGDDGISPLVGEDLFANLKPEPQEQLLIIPTPPPRRSTRSLFSRSVFNANWFDERDAPSRRIRRTVDETDTELMQYAEDPPAVEPLVPPPPVPSDELVPVPDPASSMPVLQDQYAVDPGQYYEIPTANWSPLFDVVGIHRISMGEPGIGQERVMFAPSEIDVTQPSNYWLIRVDSGSGLLYPDRNAFFWTRPSSGAQNSVNYQELRFINETGTDAFSVMTEIPVRAVQYNTTGGANGGIGDMKIATKARFINGKKWQMTQITRMYINSGNMNNGMGTGHMSLEPGLLARYMFNPNTYAHGEVKLWIPLGANQTVAGQVMTYGIGLSHVLYETDTFAFLPTIEMVAYEFLGGHATMVNTTVPYSTSTFSTNGDLAVNVIPGAKFVLGPPCDLGLVEIGISGMVGMGPREYLNNMVRVDLRFNY